MTRGSAPGQAAGPARTIFFGSGDFAVPILDAIANHPRLAVDAVVTAPERPAGRSRTSTPTPVAMRARELGLPLLQPASVRSPAVLAELAAFEPDLGILADYGRIIPQALLDVPRLGILGVHPSLLPRHRGATPVPSTILAGDPEAGVTIYRMDAGLDTGPILAQQSWPIGNDETGPSLEGTAAVVGARLLAGSLPGYLDGDTPLRPQDGTAATVTTRLARRDGWLDTDRPAVELERQIRGLAGWPGTFIETAAGRVGVVGAMTAPGVAGDVPGALLESNNGLPAVATRDGRLVLLRVQPAGGREMAGDAFLRGHRDLLGTTVTGPATVSER